MSYNDNNLIGVDTQGGDAYICSAGGIYMDWEKFAAPSEEYLRLSAKLYDLFNQHRRRNTRAESERIADEMYALNRLLDQSPEQQYLDEVRAITWNTKADR